MKASEWMLYNAAKDLVTSSLFYLLIHTEVNGQRSKIEGIL